jgi:hypothetical protein
MKRSTTFSLLIILGLLLALGSSTALARQPGAQGPFTQEALSPQGQVGTSFTYQGRLLDNGTPVDGTCDVQFQLWDDASSGSQVGNSPQLAGGVAVDDGYFAAPVDFGTMAFEGQALWLAIAVACPSGGSLTPLSGRIPLTAAPYAHSLRPGAAIYGDSGGHVLYVSNDGMGDAISAYNSSNLSNYAALYGFNDGAGTGVYGGSAGGTGIYGKGVMTGTVGIATATSGGARGVYGESASTNGAGVKGMASATSGANSGVVGESDSPDGAGVAGYADSWSGENYGVYGQTMSADGYGLYSQGNAHVEGELSWKTKTSYVSIPAAGFHPTEDGYDFGNYGFRLHNFDSASDTYVAPVQLPHGSTVTKLSFYWWDDSSEDGSCSLYRTALADTEWEMAIAQTSGAAPAENSSEDTIIDYASVDNSQYAYYLWLALPDSGVIAYGAVIEYTITEPY